MKVDLKNLFGDGAFFDEVSDVGGSVIDTDLYQCKIVIDARGIELYIGPDDPYQGGSAITVKLDHQGNYVTHTLEELEAAPG